MTGQTSPELHPSKSRMADQTEDVRSPTPLRRKSDKRPLARTRSRSPGGKEDVRDRRVAFADEQGGALAREIPSTENVADKSPRPMRLKTAKEMVPRKDGESRTQWKNRFFDYERSQDQAKGVGKSKSR